MEFRKRNFADHLGDKRQIESLFLLILIILAEIFIMRLKNLGVLIERDFIIQ